MHVAFYWYRLVSDGDFLVSDGVFRITDVNLPTCVYSILP